MGFLLFLSLLIFFSIIFGLIILISITILSIIYSSLSFRAKNNNNVLDKYFLKLHTG